MFAHFLLFITPLPLVLLVVVPLLMIAVIGLARAVRLHRKEFLLLSAPLLAAVAAAAAGLLPFRHRLGLHAVWPILIFASVGLTACEAWLRARWPRVALGVTCFAAAPLTLIVLLAARPPYDSGQETRPMIQELARVRAAGDALYVSCGARHAIAFYGPRYGIESWTANDCSYGRPRAYLKEADAFRGRSRLWFLSMLFPDEDALIVRAYLRTIGREDQVIRGADIAGQGGRIIDLYRFDLSDPARLAAATAADFPISAASSAGR